MLTLEDYWYQIGLPCEFCMDWDCAFTHRCMEDTRNAMYLIAEEMLLRGEY